MNHGFIERRYSQSVCGYLVSSLGSAMVMSIYFLVDFIVVGRGVGAAFPAGEAAALLLALSAFFVPKVVKKRK